jgi:DNA-directed RNA polymerase specialized sigma24 family protein
MRPLARRPDPRHATFEALLSHPRVLEFLRSRVRDLPDDDGDDFISQSLEALWHRRDGARSPDTLPRMMGLARHVVDGKIADHWRRKAVRAKRIVRTPNVPRDEGDPLPESERAHEQPTYVDVIAPPRSITPLDRLLGKEQLAFVQAHASDVGLTDDDLESMQALDADELTVDQAAAGRGMQADALRKRLQRIRQKLDQGWAERVAFGPRSLMALMRQALLRYFLACQKSEVPFTFSVRKRGRLRLIDQGDPKRSARVETRFETRKKESSCPTPRRPQPPQHPQ